MMPEAVSIAELFVTPIVSISAPATAKTAGAPECADWRRSARLGRIAVVTLVGRFTIIGMAVDPSQFDRRECCGRSNP